MNWCTWWVMFYLCFLFVFRIVSILVEGDVLRRVLCSQSLGFLEFFGRFVDFVGDGGGEGVAGIGLHLLHLLDAKVSWMDWDVIASH